MNKKKTCPECGRLLRERCFVFNRVTESKICNRCNKRIGTNPFYTPEPKIKGAKKRIKCTKPINKLDHQEKIVLLEELKKQGISKKKGWKRITKVEKFLRTLKKQKKEPIKQKIKLTPEI